ncbi:MAG: hypothetical protein HQ536_03730 [Parcubacteria group bacterium]|nr:hypothetical protein [Parcubacteria group bacterium]
MKVEKRYVIVPSHSGAKCIAWYDDVIKRWPITFAEIERAAKDEFSRVPHHKITLQKYECGVIMRVEYAKLKDGLDCSE